MIYTNLMYRAIGTFFNADLTLKDAYKDLKEKQLSDAMQIHYENLVEMFNNNSGHDIKL